MEMSFCDWFNVPFWLRIGGVHLALTSFLSIQFITADAVNFICTTSLSTYGLINCILLNSRVEISFFTSWLNVLQD